jgi:putative redox protein
MPRETVRIKRLNGTDLSGQLHRPAGDPQGWALLTHRFEDRGVLCPSSSIASALAARGFGVLHLDCPGVNRATGDTVEPAHADLVAAGAWLAEVHAAPVLLVGHSAGGSDVLIAVDAMPSVRAIATIGAPCAQSTPVAARRSILVLHSPQDTAVGIDNARRLYQAARHPKSFISLDGADHLLSEPADAAYAGEVIATWARRYLPELPAPPQPEHIEHVEVVGGREGLANHILVGRHRLRADEPLKLGGTDLGPAPFDLVLAGLGTCTSMTLRLYADHKGWPLEEVRVHLDHSVTRSGRERLDTIERVVELTGDLTAEQRSRMLQIADRCPVHRALSGTIQIETREG